MSASRIHRYQREENENDRIRLHLQTLRGHFDMCERMGLPIIIDPDPYAEVITYDGYATVLWIHGLN